MNLKVANLVAVQFGIFVGIMFWLGYSHLESTKPTRVAVEMPQREMPQRLVNSIRPSVPGVAPRSERPHTVDYRADRAQAQAVNTEPALTARAYDQGNATESDITSGPEEGSFVERSPAYTDADQDPAVASSDYQSSPQTVAYVQPSQAVEYVQPTQPVEYAQPSQIVVYPEPQIVVFSNDRSFGRRCRSQPRRNLRPIAQQLPGGIASIVRQPPGAFVPSTQQPPGAFVPSAQQQPKSEGPRLPGCGTAPRPNVTASTGRPQGSRSRYHR
jgi:hypothetical protein